MIVERGFRRITLLLSIVVGLGIWLVSSFIIFTILENERFQYNNHVEDYDNIVYFWSVWDANGWSGGNRNIIRHLLNSKNDYSGASFKRVGKTIHLMPHQVFPGIDESMLDIELDLLDWKVQTAKVKAFKNAQENIQIYARLGSRKFSEIVGISIAVGLPIGIIGFVVIWVIFFLLRWLVRGFCSDKDETRK